jgi:hypothetical protein
MSNLELDSQSAWLSREHLDEARDRLPILYVDIVPVRVDERGEVTAIGLLLRVSDDGRITRELVSGRVLYQERLRDALLRHVEKDLGPVALPRVPATPQPFTVAEYFPTPGVTPFHDPRQHAVSLAYVVPVSGDCAPSRTPSTWPGSRHVKPWTRTCSPTSTVATTSCCVKRWRTWASPSEAQTERVTTSPLPMTPHSTSR